MHERNNEPINVFLTVCMKDRKEMGRKIGREETSGKAQARLPAAPGSQLEKMARSTPGKSPVLASYISPRKEASAIEVTGAPKDLAYNQRTR